MAEPQIMSPKEYGLSIGYRPGQQIKGAELAKFKEEYTRYRAAAMRDWQLRTDAQGQLVRANPTTGLVMTMTNSAGQPVMAGTQGSQDPYAAYMNPTGVSGADPAAADMTNSAAFQGVQPSAAPAGNPVVPVNVNPAMQRTAGPAVPTGVTAPAPAADFAAAAAKVYKTENDVIADARAGYISKEQAQQILVNQFGLDP
jgi:hypothetical protein